MSRTIDPALTAALAASTVTPRRVGPGETALGLTPRQWREQVRRPGRVSAEGDDRAYRRWEMAQQFAFAGDHDAAVEAAAGYFDE